MGLFDSLFGRKPVAVAPAELPPIHGGDGTSSATPAIVNCASMSVADHLIDQFISERHGKKDADWKRGGEFFVSVPGSPEFTVRSIGVNTKSGSGSGPTYYFNLARPMRVAKAMMGKMGIPE